jgi:3-hydroxyacyl-CoA dehydrogenase
MAKKDGDTRIAIVGTGLIGRAWAIVFARAGHVVTLENLRDRFDPDLECGDLLRVADRYADEG